MAAINAIRFCYFFVWSKNLLSPERAHGNTERSTDMSGISDCGSTSRRRARSGNSVSNAIIRGWHTVGAVARVLATRQRLLDMDDRMLSDLGISRAQAEFELSRSAWNIAEERRRRRD
jgi:uncharacterized protein YjiS (DUF1127 family)